MTERLIFSTQEREETLLLYNRIKEAIGSSLVEGDEENVRLHLRRYMEQPETRRDVFGLNPILTSLQTAQIG